MLLYVHILNQPPYQESQFEHFDLTEETNKDSLAQHHQKYVRETNQRTRVNYSLERRLFM